MRVDMGSTWFMTGPMERKMAATSTPDEAVENAVAQPPAAVIKRAEEHVSVHSQGAPEEPREKSLAERLAEQGFVNFVEQLQAEKREKMREEILTAMGLSEESLADMPHKQRAQIEKLVEDEIQRRMAGAAIMNKDENEQKVQPGELIPGHGNLDHGPVENLAGTNGRAIDKLGVGMGLGPLLALQEVATERAETGRENSTNEHGKKDPAS